MQKWILLSLVSLFYTVNNSYCQQIPTTYPDNVTNMFYSSEVTKYDSSIKLKSIPTVLGQTVKNYVSDFWYILSSPARISKKNACRAGGIALMTGILFIYDQEIIDGVRRNRDNPLQKFVARKGKDFEPMGQIEKMNPYCFIGLATGLVTGYEPLRDASFQILVSLSIASTIKNAAGQVIGRARPSVFQGPRYFKFNTGYSFPSGHTSNAFQVATILSHHFNYLPFTVLSYGLATSVGFQRMDANLHWATDVFIGAVFGTAVAKTIIKLHENRNMKVSPTLIGPTRSVGLNIRYQF